MENRLTDEQIIKALECCFLSECACKDCPYSNLEICDTTKMINTVIDLINRQKAEIDRLQAMHKEMCIGMKVLKRKAIKEFWDKLKEKRYGGIYPYVLITEGDNLVKEMEGELK